MKTGKVGKILAIALSAAALAVYGCGRDGGSGGTTTPVTTTTTTTTVSTSAQAQSAGAAATSSTSLSAGVGNTLSNIAAPLSTAGVHVPRYKSSLADKDPAVKVINDALEKAVANNAPLMRATTSLRSAALSTGSRATSIPSTTSNCANGGTVTFSGSYDATVTPATLSLAATFLDCKEDNQRNNGYMSMTGTFSTSGTTVSETFTMALRDTASGTGNFTSDFFANNYTVLTGKLAENMSISGTSTVATTTTTFTGTGTMNYTDFLNAGQTYTITLTNLKETMSSATVSAVTTTTSTVNGTVKEEWTASGTANSVTIVFGTTTADFALTIVSASTYEDTTANGTIVITTTPATLCSGGGTFVIATPTAIRYDKSLNHTTAGRGTINTDQVVMVWKSDGSIDVSLNGGTATNYANENAFQTACSFADLPTNTGTTTTTVTSGTTTNTTGSSLTATLTWQNSASATAATNSDMDLHLNYYSIATPTSTSSPATGWPIYYGNRTVTFDSTHTGTLDYDMCAGGGCPTGTVTAGPEHITLQALPQGYYVLSVNSWTLSSDPGAIVTVTLQIGSNTYSFPTKTLTVSDGYGTNYTNAWYRVTDILVDSTGVHLKPADTAVKPAPPLSSRATKVKL